MSHLTVLKTEFRNLDALKAAAIALGHPLLEGGEARYYMGTSGPVDWTMKLPGRYDVGFKRAADGSYTAHCDSEVLTGSYGANDAARTILGEHLGKLKQEYGASVAAIQGRAKGFAFSRRESDLTRGEVQGAVYVTLLR